MNRKYTQAHIDYIAANIQGCPFKELTDMFNKQFGMNLKVSAMVSLSDRHGLHNGRDARFNKGWEPTQFKKGHVPFNKGMKGVFLGGEAAKAAQFKKGNKSWNRVPLGSERINGDGNNRNFDPDNLILVSRAQLAILNKNRLIQNNADLTRTGIIVVDVYRKIGERKKTKKKGESHGFKQS